MSVPAKKNAKARVRKRKAGQGGLTKALLVKCPNCKAPKKPHVACAKCGIYKGKSIASKSVAQVVKKKSKKNVK